MIKIFDLLILAGRFGIDIRNPFRKNSWYSFWPEDSDDCIKEDYSKTGYLLTWWIEQYSCSYLFYPSHPTGQCTYRWLNINIGFIHIYISCWPKLHYTTKNKCKLK